MNSGKTANSGEKRRGEFSVPRSPSITKPRAKSEDRALNTLNEYMGKQERLREEPLVSPTRSGEVPKAAADSNGNRHSSPKERLPQEWEIEEPVAADAPSEEDIIQRLDRLERRLDAFENTSYTFLLYAKQLTDRTVSFFEDIFGLGREDLAQIHDRLGVNYNNKENYPRAIEAFKNLVELNRTPASCFKLGVAYDNNGDTQEAIEAYRSAIALDAGYLKAYYKLAEVYAKTENYGEAIRCLMQAAEIDPENAETHYRLGSIHSARGSYDQAIVAFNRVLALAPEFPGIYQSMGIAYEQKGEHNRAIEFFKKSL